jgi:hypothetical protein
MIELMIELTAELTVELVVKSRGENPPPLLTL